MSSLPGLIAAALGIAGVIGGALGVLMSQRCRSTIDLQRAGLEELERQNNRRGEELESLRPRLAAAEDKIELLTEMVTSAAKVDELAAVSAVRHEELLTALASLSEAILRTPPPRPAKAVARRVPK